MSNATPTGQRTTALKILSALLACCLALTLGACTGKNSASNTSPDQDSWQASGPIEVVASINQWGSLATQIGGNDVHVTSIVNTTSVDAHDFEPKTADIAQIQKAQVVVTNGAGYDLWAQKSIAKGSVSISAADAVGASTGDNPHLWFSKDARRAMASELRETFAKKLPSRSKAFTSRYNTWLKQEKTIEATMKQFAQDHDGTTYGATEPVAYYLLDDMGFEDKTPKGYAQSAASEGEPAPADLQNFKELISSREVSMLINNTQEASDTTNILTGTAGRSEVPVVDVSEQMPSDMDGLSDWMSHIIGEIQKAMASFKKSEATHRKTNPNEPDAGTTTDNGATSNDASSDQTNGNSNSKSTTSGVPSNEGQQDPGK